MKLINKIMTCAFLVAILSATSFSQVGQDNSKVNEADSTLNLTTADRQKSNQEDMQITARIRKDIMSQKSFSTYAQNIKIITTNGTVTLKGPVRSMNELNSIVKFARSAAGASNVVNEIAVTPETTY